MKHFLAVSFQLTVVYLFVFCTLDFSSGVYMEQEI